MRSNPLHLSLAALALLATAGPVLRAVEPNYGFQFGLASTTGDIADEAEIKAMAGLGLHMLIPVAEGQAIRPRVDIWSGSKSVTYLSGGNSLKTEVTLTTTLLGADYLYYLQGNRDRGLYFLAGLALSANKGELELALNGAREKDSASCTRPAYTLGAGYQLGRRWGLEARYNTTSFAHTGFDTLNVNTFSFAATFRFK